MSKYNIRLEYIDKMFLSEFDSDYFIQKNAYYLGILIIPKIFVKRSIEYYQLKTLFSMKMCTFISIFFMETKHFYPVLPSAHKSAQIAKI